MVKKEKFIINQITGEVTQAPQKISKPQRIAIFRNTMDVGYSKEFCQKITTTFQKNHKKYFKDSYFNFIRNLQYSQISTGLNHYVRDIIVIDIDSKVNLTEIKSKLKDLNISGSIMVKKQSGHCQIHIGISQIQIKDPYNEISTEFHTKYLNLTKFLNSYFGGDLNFTGWRCQNPFYKTQFKFVEICSKIYDFDTLYSKFIISNPDFNILNVKKYTVGETVEIEKSETKFKTLESRDLTLFKRLWIFFNSESNLKPLECYTDFIFETYQKICKKFNNFNDLSSPQQILSIARSAYSKIIDNFKIPSVYSDAQRNISRLTRFINKIKRINGLSKMSPQLKYAYKFESFDSLSDQLLKILSGSVDYGSTTLELYLKEALNQLAFFKVLNSEFSLKNPIKNIKLKYESFKMNSFDSLKSFLSLNLKSKSILKSFTFLNHNFNISNYNFIIKKSIGFDDAFSKHNFSILNVKKYTEGENVEVEKTQSLLSSLFNIINIFYRKMNDFEYSTRLLPEIELVPKNNVYYTRNNMKLIA